jgi:hypothetical protein
LTARRWAGDYLDIAPRYRSITEEILCAVEGANQGLERIGRERIAFMITTDEPVRTDKFDYDEDEAVSSHQFTTRHVFGGWHLALIKSDAFVYALIVDSDELGGLEDLATDAKLLGVRHPDVAARLRILEGCHVHCVPLGRPPIPHPCFGRGLSDDDVVSLSPFVVIRQMDWRYHKQVLIVNYVNGRVVRRGARDRRVLLELARAAPITLGALLQRAATDGHGSPLSWRRTLHGLHRHGVIGVRHGSKAEVPENRQALGQVQV